MRAQIERMSLLHQITRAVGERQDLPSIFQVVIRTLEDQMPVDFGCICLYDAAANDVMVASVGLRSAELAMELALTEQQHVNIGDDCVAKAVLGQLIYEPDTSVVDSPFPQRLAKGGLRAMVAVPMLIEGKVFGVLVAARHAPNSFSSGECEFLTHLSEHVALAAQHAQLYARCRAPMTTCAKRSRPSCSRSVCARSDRWRAALRTTSTTRSRRSRCTPSLCWSARTSLSAPGRGQLQVIQRAIGDVAQTVARMREFYRPREPQMMLERVQLNELVQQVVDLTRVRWNDMPQQRGVTIELQRNSRHRCRRVMGADSEIREALTNLVFNAVDAMPEGGTIDAAHARRRRRACTSRSSTPASAWTRMRGAAASSRSSPPRASAAPASGLAMVYGMVQRHSADIAIESELGQGTTVRLTFRRRGCATRRCRSATPVEVPTGLHILLVDDDPVLLKSLRDALEADGHTIVTANGGREGIETFREAHESEQIFSAVVTDLGMPYVDGRQVANAVKSISPDAPVILLTGWGQRLQAEGRPARARGPGARQAAEAARAARGAGALLREVILPATSFSAARSPASRPAS